RAAPSLLAAIGLPELVTPSLDGYEACALRLATEPPLLAKLRDRLQQKKLTYPLFNPDCYRRQIEAGYTTMWKTCQREEPPRSFAISAGDPPRSSFSQPT